MFDILGLVSIVALAAMGGCATGQPAQPHQHMRDAKQGSTYPAPAEAEAPRKLLHDHREMK